jgi:hypothetical protein
MSFDLSKRWGYHVGDAIFLPPNNEDDSMPFPAVPNVVYRSSSQQYTDNYLRASNMDVMPDIKSNYFLSAHVKENYVDKVNFLAAFGSDPLAVSGFSTGTQCQVDMQCSNNLCIKNMCAESLAHVEESCEDNSDCQTGRCDYNLMTWNFLCMSTLSNGSLCNEHSDCQSGQCVRYWRWLRICN